MTRRTLREHLFQLIYLGGFNSGEEMPEQVSFYLDEAEQEIEEGDREEQMTEKDRDFLKLRWAAVTSKITEIDDILNHTAKGWKTSRFPSCDLAILRLAVYEMLFDDSIPVGVAINEAVELGKKYGGGDSPSFINGVLGHIARSRVDGDKPAENSKLADQNDKPKTPEMKEKTDDPDQKEQKSADQIKGSDQSVKEAVADQEVEVKEETDQTEKTELNG